MHSWHTNDFSPISFLQILFLWCFPNVWAYLESPALPNTQIEATIFMFFTRPHCLPRMSSSEPNFRLMSHQVCSGRKGRETGPPSQLCPSSYLETIMSLCWASVVIPSWAHRMFEIKSMEIVCKLKIAVHASLVVCFAWCQFFCSRKCVLDDLLWYDTAYFWCFELQFVLTFAES